jgi:hypothetical protein
MKAKKPIPLAAEPPPEPLQCEHCAHWSEQSERTDEYRWGWCHRYPPTVICDSDGDPHTTAPDTAANHPSCGEFKQRLNG